MAVKVQVYSALYGGYDTVKPLPEGVSGLLYSDLKDLEPGTGWELRHVPHSIVTRNGDLGLVAPMLAHKYWKTHPHVAAPDADASIWVDASIQLDRSFIGRAVAALGFDDWALVPHPWRSCVFDEAEFSAILPRYASMVAQLRAQADFYRSIGHPPRWGLAATGIGIRRHTQAVIDVCESWWWENITRTHQDQVSLPVLLRLNEQIQFNYNLGWEQGWALYPHLK